MRTFSDLTHLVFERAFVAFDAYVAPGLNSFR
jgi:hypothetical protein